MNLDYVPLFRVMREIQGIPRGQPPDFNGMKRFRHFVRMIFPRKRNGEIDENAVYLIPLLAINPMAKDHVTALLDAYLAMDADGIGARVAAEVSARLADVPGDFKVCLIVLDDLMGPEPTATKMNSPSASGLRSSRPKAARRSVRGG